MARLRLGDLLLAENLIEQQDLDAAIEQQKKTGEKLGRTLIEMGAVSESVVLNLLSKQLQIPFVDLTKEEVNPKTVYLLPETYARRFRAIVIGEDGDALLVGMADPLDIHAFDAVSRMLKRPVHMAVVSEFALLSVVDRVYRRSQEISHFAQELSGEMIEEEGGFQDALFDEAVESDDQAAVVKLLNSIFHDAVQARASDIHIEPDVNVLRIRLRVDGVLNESVLDDRRIAQALVQRLKLRSGLDISEKRVPQDGRFHFKVKSKMYDVRVSTLPTASGEAVVMRILDQSASISDLADLGIAPEMVSRIEAIYTKPNGMLLVTGPTGSGKSTTLYSVIARLNAPEVKIITVEDPVEYRIPRINQVQVNSKIDLSFARVLRAMLRQDPDVIMVGEIRDAETAQIAMRAAVTGHLVLATLHTNDAITSALRLIDMGADGYMVAAAIKGIIGQALVRTLCRRCSVKAPPDDNEKEWLISMGVDPTLPFKKAVGCSYCASRGYWGRVGVYELLEPNTAMLTALRLNDAERFTKAALESPHYRPLSESILDLVKSNQTSISEAMKMIGILDQEAMDRKMFVMSAEEKEL